MGKKLSLLDSSWLTLESKETPMHVGSLAIFSLPKNAPDDFLNKLYQRFRGVSEYAAPFNQKLSSPNSPTPSWLNDDKLDIDYHLRHSALPGPGGERELMILVSRLHGSLLDRTRPLWECHIIEGLTENRFAIYTKMHHSMVDGVAGMKLLQASFAEDPNTEVGPPWEKSAANERKRRKSSGSHSLLKAITGQMTDQIKTIPGLARTFGNIGKVALTSAAGKSPIPYQAPKTNLNPRISGQRLFVVQPFELDRIRALGKKSGKTINDIVMALCAGCMRKYMQEHDVLPDTPLIANVPVSIRPEGSEGGNAISTLLCSLATNVDDPAERLNIIHDSMNAGKNQLQAMSQTEIINYTMLVNLPFTIGQIVGTAGRVRPMYNIVISNVPGPKKHLYLNGAKMEALYPISLIFNGQAVNVTITSYVDTLDFAFTACRRSMPKVTQLPRYIREAMEELEASVK
nr:putative wax ester synthase/acyl-CoA:diacylglycerol acyltransferase [uncultured bacterium]